MRDEVIGELARRGLRVDAGMVIDWYGDRWTLAWSYHLRRWECQVAHVDMHLREVQALFARQ